MHHQPGIMLDIARIGLVIVNAVAVEGDGGITEQQCWSCRKFHSISRWFYFPANWVVRTESAFFAANDILAVVDDKIARH